MSEGGRPRLTGGIARSRPLAEGVPPGVRPTSSRVREAIFSIVGHDLSGLAVLDAFGGTGLLGLEAWSRGASVTIVERDRRAAAVVSANARALGADVRVVLGDVLEFARSASPFDVVLVDPPYAVEPGPLLERLGPLATGVLVLETDERTVSPAGAGTLTLERRRSYGGTSISVYRAPLDASDAEAER